MGYGRVCWGREGPYLSVLRAYSWSVLRDYSLTQFRKPNVVPGFQTLIHLRQDKCCVSSPLSWSLSEDIYYKESIHIILGVRLFHVLPSELWKPGKLLVHTQSPSDRPIRGSYISVVQLQNTWASRAKCWHSFFFFLFMPLPYCRILT